MWQAGGFPVEMPVLSLSETFMKPTAMFYRNLLAMEVEEVLRCHPIDGAVLMGGCDKTTPGADHGRDLGGRAGDLRARPGRCSAGTAAAPTLGSGTDAWKYWAERWAGNLDECAMRADRGRHRPLAGHCMTMGTASTMTSIAEALGLTLPGAASIPAVHSAHARMATASAAGGSSRWCGRTCARRDILTADAFDNAIATDMAIGGSTNAIIHLIAMARRAGVSADRSSGSTRSRRDAGDRQPAAGRRVS